MDGHDELIMTMLQAMEPLVAYGFYWKNEIAEECIKALIFILSEWFYNSRSKAWYIIIIITLICFAMGFFADHDTTTKVKIK